MYDFLNREIFLMRKFKVMSLILMSTNLIIIFAHSFLLIECFITGETFIGAIMLIISISINSGLLVYNYAHNKILFGETV